jgi:non-ribosomal peptide synthetase component F
MLRLPAATNKQQPYRYRGKYQSFQLPAGLYEQLKTLSRRESATLFMTLLAAFKALLHRYMGQQDIIVGTAIANRTRSHTEGLIGPFINMLPLRTGLSAGIKFIELLGRVRRVALEAYAHQEIPFEKIVEHIQPERAANHMPLVQVAFGLHSAPRRPVEVEGLKLSSMEFDYEAIRMDLTVWMVESPVGLQAYWTYNTALYSSESIEMMQRHFERLLYSIAANPASTLNALEMRTDDEKRQEMLEEIEWEESNVEKLTTIKRRAINLSLESI